MRPVSRAELSRIAGVSGAAITKACGKQLSAACTSDRVDLDHPSVVAYLAGKGRAAPAPDRAPTMDAKRAAKRRSAKTVPSKRPAKRRGPPTGRRPSPPPPEPIQPRAEAVQLDAWARLLRPLADRFGTARGFRDWLLALKDLEVIRAKTLENEETEGRLISRELVKTHVLGAVEAANRRLLTDSPKTIARRVYAAANTKVPVEDAEQIVREAISSQLKPAQETAARLLRGDRDAPV